MLTIGWSRFLYGIAFIVLLLPCACGGGSGGDSAGGISPNPISVVLSPDNADVLVNGTQSFTATVSGSAESSVLWAVDNIPNGDATVGTVSGSGNTITYRAPDKAGIHSLSAKSVADPAKSGISSISVCQNPVSVSLAPTSASLLAKGTLSFTATVSGSTNTAVTWTVDDILKGDSSVGTISGSGNTITYQAPSTAGNHTLRATSSQYPTKNAASTISVLQNQVSVLLAPGSASLPTNGTKSFTATVSGSSNTAVSWTVDNVLKGNSSVGTISGSGNTITYQAPSLAGNHTLRAASAQDPTKSAASTISVVQNQVTVALSPDTASTVTAGTVVLHATVSGSTNTAVTWTVDGIVNGNAAVGTVSGSGNEVIYTAPSSDGSHILVATSLADASKSDSSKILVRDSCAPDPTSTLIMNVKDYGARGNNMTNDTIAIQNAVDAMVKKGGGTVLVPSGTYLVDAAGGGVLLGSNITLRLDLGATLKAITSTSSAYNILRVNGASNVNIVGGGTLQGERASHTGSGGEQGHGLWIGNSHHVVVENVTSRDCWGDGFYVGASSTDVTLCNVVADNNRRAGISITSVDGLMIRNSIFKNTHGTIGECGLNIEPNEGETVNDVQILGSTFEDNWGTGLGAGMPCAHNGSVSHIVIDGNTMRHNGWGGISGAKSGIEISKCRGTGIPGSGIRITGNTSTNNAENGILLRACGASTSMGANDSTVSGNTVSNNELAGIYEAYCDDNTITSNAGTGNKRYGILSNHCTNYHISGNAPGLPVTVY